MTDFEQPKGYTYIDDGRLPEEQPGVVWETPHGMRITESARQALESEFSHPRDIPEAPELTSDQVRERNRIASAVLTAASAGIDQRLPFSKRLKAVADNMGRPGFANQIKVELEKIDA